MHYSAYAITTNLPQIILSVLKQLATLHGFLSKDLKHQSSRGLTTQITDYGHEHHKKTVANKAKF